MLPCLAKIYFYLFFLCVFVLFLNYVVVYLCVGLCSCVHLEARGVGFLELELQLVVSHLKWELGTRFGSSSRAMSVLFFLFYFWFFKAEFLCVVLAVLELALYTRLALNSQRSICLCLLSARIKGVCHHCPATTSILNH